VKYLVDTDVLSEAMKPYPNPKVINWGLINEPLLAVSPIVLGEILAGILALPRSKRRDLLVRWFKDQVRLLTSVEIDSQTAEIWAELVADLRRKGKSMPVKDSLIAASARQHGLILVTRNVGYYQYAGVNLFNPFAG
jgi:predicted nucleic acid-binding protein